MSMKKKILIISGTVLGAVLPVGEDLPTVQLKGNLHLQKVAICAITS